MRVQLPERDLWFVTLLTQSGGDMPRRGLIRRASGKGGSSVKLFGMRSGRSEVRSNQLDAQAKRQFGPTRFTDISVLDLETFAGTI